MKQEYKTINFNDANAALIEQIDSIVKEYQAQGFRMTVRQVYYQCIARDIIPDSWIDAEYNARKGLPLDTKNTVKNYKRLAGLINDAKLAGLLDWEAMEDITREFERRSRWDSGGAILRAVAQQYHEDIWNDQDWRVFVIVEKDALLGVLRRTCEDLDVPLMAARGYASSTVLREFALSDIVPTLNGDDREPKNVCVLHLGDHDPSGIDMTRDLDDRLQLFVDADRQDGGDKEFQLVRIALTMEQIEELKPPENPAKTTDARFEGYRRRFGASSWELDALTPTYLDRLVRRQVALYCDEKKFARRRKDVEAEKKKLLKVAEAWK